MTQENFKKARKFLIACIAAALLTMGAVSGLYYWKGLQNLSSKDNPDSSYYILF